MDTPDTATLPRTCLDIHMATPAAPDGTYTLYHDSVAYAIYCAHMATAPTEYLTLPTSGGGSNVFSTYDSPLLPSEEPRGTRGCAAQLCEVE